MVKSAPEEIPEPYAAAGDPESLYTLFTDGCESSFYRLCSGLRQSQDNGISIRRRLNVMGDGLG